MARQNPAYLFMARTLAEKATGKPWHRLSRSNRLKWLHLADELIIAMYGAGFNIPQPEDPDAVYRALGVGFTP
jgi:hypothetical protein